MQNHTFYDLFFLYFRLYSLPGCREHTHAGQCFLMHSGHSCQLHKTADVPNVAHGHNDMPKRTHWCIYWNIYETFMKTFEKSHVYWYILFYSNALSMCNVQIIKIKGFLNRLQSLLINCNLFIAVIKMLLPIFLYHTIQLK